jgi:hypothetical protein
MLRYLILGLPGGGVPVGDLGPRFKPLILESTGGWHKLLRFSIFLTQQKFEMNFTMCQGYLQRDLTIFVERFQNV